MARKRKKSKIYYNNATGTWSNDSGEQPYLMPGTEAYDAYQEQLSEKEAAKAGDAFHESLSDKNESLRDEQIEKSKKVNEAYDVGNRKFRLQRMKAANNKAIEKSLSDGLGYNVDIDGGLFDSSKLDSMYDDGVDEKSYKKSVIKAYSKEIESVRETPTVDTNGDGKIDKDDIVMTPGMKALNKYM